MDCVRTSQRAGNEGVITKRGNGVIWKEDLPKETARDVTVTYLLTGTLTSGLKITTRAGMSGVSSAVSGAT